MIPLFCFFSFQGVKELYAAGLRVWKCDCGHCGQIPVVNRADIQCVDGCVTEQQKIFLVLSFVKAK